MSPKTLQFSIVLILFLSACSELPDDNTNTPVTVSQASQLDTLARLVIPAGVAYTDVYGGLAVSDKPILISHSCEVPASQRRFLTPGASATQGNVAVASWWGGKAPGAMTMEAWRVGHSDADLKWLAVAAMVYCQPSEFYYGNGVDTTDGRVQIDEVVWTVLKEKTK